MVATLVTFIFVAVILNPSRGGHPGHAPLVTAIVSIVVFGGGSVLFYEHFNRKNARSPEGTDPSDATGANWDLSAYVEESTENVQG